MDLGFLAPAAFLVAALYSSVGHGGASGYLAAMALVGMAPSQMKPTALLLNVLVAGLATFRYWREGCFQARAFGAFAAGSIPASFIGGAMGTAPRTYQIVLGGTLLLAAIALLIPRKDKTKRALPILLGVLLGALIGFVSGMIGVGGGIFLSPILILAGWAGTRETLGTSSAFILVNSAAGLLGHLASLQDVPAGAGVLAGCAFAGGLVGTELGSRRLAPQWIRWVLGLVLAIAAAKLILS